MKNLIYLAAFLVLMLNACASDQGKQDSDGENNSVVWEPGTNVEEFWAQYAASKGGLTWGTSDTYPEYEKVNEGDTFMVVLSQGPCLMEFFHNRWRRANDVRRWDESINDYGGCPFVFD